MKIEANIVIRFNYQLSGVNDRLLEQSDDKIPMAYLDGHPDRRRIL